MATKAGGKSAQGSSGMDWSSRVRNSMGGGSNVAGNQKRDNEDVPWSLIATVMAVVLMFFIVMPILAFMYYDMWFATQAAVHEVKKMKQLRREIQEERRQGNAYGKPTEATDTRE
jgi:ABC-type Fe3+ transport system permease subunit